MIWRLYYGTRTIFAFYQKAHGIKSEIGKVVLGKEEIITKILATALAGGHVLLDDIPGVGKTTLALAFSFATSMDYKRLQFTPDVLPTDVTGFSVYDKKTDSFQYKPGAAICNLFLADEINRTSSKTQSALLEIMEEGKVTVDGITRNMPDPYIVIATQNPIGYVGTQMLPDSQLDRFMVCLSMGYPNFENEVSILSGRQTHNPLDDVKAVATKEDADCVAAFARRYAAVALKSLNPKKESKIMKFMKRLGVKYAESKKKCSNRFKAFVFKYIKHLG